MCLAASPSSLSPPALRLLLFVSFPICSLLLFLYSSLFLSAAVSFSFCCPGRSNPGRLRPRTLQSRASAPRMFQLWCVASPDVPGRVPYAFVRLPLPPGCSSPGGPVASDVPVCRTGCTPQTIQSGGLGGAPVRPRCSNLGPHIILLSALPGMLQSVARGSPPEDPVRGLGPCSNPPGMLQSGALYYLTLSVSSDAPVRGTGFSPGRSSPGARAVLQSAPDAPIRGVIVSYSLCCLRRLRVWCLGFFFRAPIVVAPPPLPPAPLCVPSRPFLSLSPPSLFPPPPPPSPSVPFLPSPAPFLSLCGGFAGARTQAPRFYARMLLCFGAGTHVNLSSFFPAFSLFSCFALLQLSLLLPHALCVAFEGLLVTSHLLFGARTHAPIPTHALCHLLFRIRYALLPHAIYALHSLCLATPKSRRVFLMPQSMSKLFTCYLCSFVVGFVLPALGKSQE